MKRLLRAIYIIPIQVYRAGISPLLPHACRFTPSCSDYTIQAIRKYGILKGTRMGVKRISRCHPWGDSGYDPVV